MSTIKFNERFPQTIERLPSPQEKIINCAFKYANLDRVIARSNPYINFVLERMMRAAGKCTNPLVDIKWHEFNIGDYPCVPGWHLDGYKGGETFFLFVSGDPLTEFLPQSIEFSNIEGFTVGNYSKLYGPQITTKIGTPIPNNTIVKYTSSDFHRCGRATQKCQRLLVRLCINSEISGR